MAKGLAFKSLSWLLRVIEFCCAAIILGIFAYFIAALNSRDLYIATYIKAVEGISGAAVIYTAFALILVCCLGGIMFFSIIGMLLDLAFMGAFIYLAYATRGGRDCSGIVNTPLGDGPSSEDIAIVVGNRQDGFVRLPSLKTACHLNTACFAVAIIGAVFFLLSFFVELLLIRNRKKEKAYESSPNNGYIAETRRRRFWQRKPRESDMEFAATKNPDALPHHAVADTRASYATDATAIGNEPVVSKYGHGGPGYAPPGAGYVAPVGTAVGAAPLATNAHVDHGYQTTTTTHIPHQKYETYSPPANTTGNF